MIPLHLYLYMLQGRVGGVIQQVENRLAQQLRIQNLGRRLHAAGLVSELDRGPHQLPFIQHLAQKTIHGLTADVLRPRLSRIRQQLRQCALAMADLITQYSNVILEIAVFGMFVP